MNVKLHSGAWMGQFPGRDPCWNSCRVRFWRVDPETGGPKALACVPMQVQLTAEVSDVLYNLGLAHTVNALIENELLAVDIALPGQAGAQPTAVLLEGPPAFSRNMPFRPLGATLLRWRLLLSCNWRVR